ncbi:helix-turn-helix domain-containing protein [Micromonospora globispora]|uniref:helix-turn-helix domain-containing protein n=1 Tax=Micromonospora globispora TaxID=1450148 RepID=UPI001FAED470|nr:helix-turn-helix transcriptional regulator [Micromonospora globispora]
MSDSRVASQIAAALRRERGARFLTQHELADLAGLSQSAVARVERGNRMPSIPLVERLFAALGLQLAVGVEPLESHLDARMTELASRPLTERIEDLGLDRVIERLGDLPHLLAGSTPPCSRALRCRSTRWISRCGGATRRGSPPG